VCAVILCLAGTPAAAEQTPPPICGPARVVDGDRLVIGDTSFRLLGMLLGRQGWAIGRRAASKHSKMRRTFRVAGITAAVNTSSLETTPHTTIPQRWPCIPSRSRHQRRRIGCPPSFFLSAQIPVRGVRRDGQRATITTSSVLAHVWNNCTGARKFAHTLNVVEVEVRCDD